MRALFIIITVSFLLVYFIYLIFFSFTDFEDDRYNLALIKRSSLTDTYYFLESSLLHLYYEQYPVVRAEDWHRGFSIVTIVLANKLFATNNESILRIPHLLWCLYYLFICSAILLLLLRNNNHTSKLKLWIAPILLLYFALLVNPFGYLLLSNPFLEDVSAASCILTSLWFFLRRASLSFVDIIAIGALTGLSYCMKDIYLIWSFIWLAILLTGIKHPSFSRFRMLLIFIIPYLLFFTVKSGWRLYEIGGLLDNPIVHWIRVYHFSINRIDVHHPFFLYGDKSYLSRIELAGGLMNSFKLLYRPMSEILSTFRSMPFIVLWLLVHIIRRDHYTKDFRTNRLTHVIILSLLYYVLFFAMGFGHAVQLRHWGGIITMIVILGVFSLCGLFKNNINNRSTVATNGILYLVCTAILMLTLRGVYILHSMKCVPPYSEEVVGAAKNVVNINHTVLCDTKGGMYLWSRLPELKIVSLPENVILSLDSLHLVRFLRIYDVRYALLLNSKCILFVKTLGYDVVIRSKRGETLLKKSNTTRL